MEVTKELKSYNKGNATMARCTVLTGVNNKPCNKQASQKVLTDGNEQADYLCEEHYKSLTSSCSFSMSCHLDFEAISDNYPKKTT